MKFNSFGKLQSWKIPFLVIAIAWPVSILLLYGLLYSKQTISKVSAADPNQVLEPQAVAALGYLEPAGEVINLSGTVLAEGARVDKLLVKQGEQVNAGQTVAILDSRDRLDAALKRAQTQVKIARSRLEQVKAGAKSGEINAQKARIANLEAELQGQKLAQKATIERLEAELSNAETECDRFERLYTDGAVTASNRDLKCLEKETARKRVIESKVTLKRIEDSGQEEIVEAQATLNQIAEIRPVDLVLAEAELEDAIVGVQQAQAELDLASVRSPSDGQILKIHTWPGEIISDQGIVELGQTGQMYVKAEVYETDISRVHLGQQSTITSDGFPGQLRGKVDEIGLQIGKKEVLSTNPAIDVDSRVVEVKIRLDSEDSLKVAGLTNLQVKVVIDSSN